MRIAMVNWSDRVAFGGRSLQVRDVSVALESFGHEVSSWDGRSLGELRHCLGSCPDVLHVHGGITPVLGCLLQVSGIRSHAVPTMVCTLHGWHYRGLADALEQRIERVGMYACARVTVPSHVMLATLPRTLRKRTTVIPNGIPAVPIPEWRPARDRTDVIWIGRVSSAKGIRVGLQAFSAARKSATGLRMHVVGTIEEPTIGLLLAEAQARSEGAIRYWGALDRPWYCVQPSILLHTPRYDAFPRVVLEAMSLGVPVVATAVGGIPEMLDNGASGLLADDEDVSGLAARLAALADDEALRQRVGHAARDRFETDYRIEVMARRIEAIYRELRGL
jgi:glycosyltransferase involved in cell wall biosynthesis